MELWCHQQTTGPIKKINTLNGCAMLAWFGVVDIDMKDTDNARYQ